MAIAVSSFTNEERCVTRIVEEAKTEQAKNS